MSGVAVGLLANLGIFFLLRRHRRRQPERAECGRARYRRSLGLGGSGGRRPGHVGHRLLSPGSHPEPGGGDPSILKERGRHPRRVAAHPARGSRAGSSSGRSSVRSTTCAACGSTTCISGLVLGYCALSAHVLVAEQTTTSAPDRGPGGPDAGGAASDRPHHAPSRERSVRGRPAFPPATSTPSTRTSPATEGGRSTRPFEGCGS